MTLDRDFDEIKSVQDSKESSKTAREFSHFLSRNEKVEVLFGSKKRGTTM